MTTVRLGEVASFLSGFAFKSEKFNAEGRGMPIVRIRDISRGHSETFFDGTYDDRYLVRNGDFLIGMDGEFNLAVWRGGEALLNQRVCKLDKLKSGVDRKYVARFLPLALKKIEDATPFVTVKHLSVKDLNEVNIPLPPLDEQRRIAAILDRAEELRSKRRAAISLLDDIPQAIFLEMFGDPKINSKRFKLATFGQVISEMRGGANLAPEDFTDEGFPILHKGAIKANGEVLLDTKKKTCVSEQFASEYFRNQAGRDHLAVTLRDLVPTGPAIGFIADLENGPSDRYVLSQGAYAFKVDLERVNPKYLVALSNMPSFRHILRQNAVGSTQIHIRTPIFQAITFPLPPTELQTRFAARIEAIHRAKAAYQSAITELDSLFSSLQKRAFSDQPEDSREHVGS